MALHDLFIGRGCRHQHD